MRDYQQEMLERLHDAWEEQQSVMVQMPAGTGKTHLMAAVIRDNMAHGVLIVAHRVELIGQISQTLESFGIEHGIVDRTTLDLDRKTKERFIGIYKNGGDLCKYFNVDGLNSDEITALTHEKIAALTEFDRTHYGTH